MTGNVKQVWELSRHHHLTVLAAAWWLTGDERYAEAVAAQLRSWWAGEPVPLRRALDQRDRARRPAHHLGVGRAGCSTTGRASATCSRTTPRPLRQIRWHQEYLAAFRSRGSSANNHVVAEAAGRLAAACAFPWFAESADVARGAPAQLLERRAAPPTPSPTASTASWPPTTTASSPSSASWPPSRPRPHGTRSSEATLAVPGRGCSTRPPRSRRDRPAAAAGRRRRGPRARPRRPGRATRGPALLAGGAGPAGRARLVAGARRRTCTVLLRRRARSPRARLPRPPRPATRGSPTPAWSCCAPAPRTGREIWCRCDGGPHGFLSIAAHAHADALSVEVRHDGVDILADPGTYCYHGEPAWRDYFRSTAAHNTLEVAGVSQAESRRAVPVDHQAPDADDDLRRRPIGRCRPGPRSTTATGA